jgi:hypothetical protein
MNFDDTLVTQKEACLNPEHGTLRYYVCHVVGFSFVFAKNFLL